MKKTFNYLVLSLITLVMLSFFSCQNKNEHHHQMNMDHAHHIHHEHQPEIQLDADIPIFSPGEKTYQNELDFVTAKGFYVRYNTDIENEQAIRDFYLEKLPEEGWMLNEAKTTHDKIVVQKGKRHMSIRFFDMETAGEKSLAYAINLVEPTEKV